MRQGFRPSLPAARQVLLDTNKLTIIALGSSTTAGVGASSTDRSYPAVLEAELKRRLPGRQILVLNKGMGGNSALDMLLRMDADVIEEKPSLVIWQTVVNDAIRDVGEEKLSKILRKGIRKIQEAGADLVMMDLPWLPRAGRYPQYDGYRAVLAQAAREFGVPVFPRYEVMRGWARSKQFSEEELVGMDGVQMIESSYRCLGLLLADGIAGAMTDGRAGLAAR